jgi:hypothetical protein
MLKEINQAQLAANMELPSGPMDMSGWDPEFAYEYGLYAATTGSAAPPTTPGPSKKKTWLEENQTTVIAGAVALVVLALVTQSR